MENVSFGNGWEGRVVEGRFPLLEWLGGSESRGSFFTVLQGLQEAVIQLILAGGAEADEHIAQWDFAMALSHPHLVKVLAAGRCVIDGRDLVYVVTERSYSTLAKIIQSGALKADSARDTFIPVLDALSYLHKNGVVHGHINPLNLQFADLKPKLPVTDLLTAGSIKRSIETASIYDAPELTDGVVTAAADTWSIGMTLWEAMAQAPPSWEHSRQKEPEVSGSLPSPFRDIVQDCLRMDPLRRCTILSIVERLEGAKSIPSSESPIPVRIDNPPRALENPLRDDLVHEASSIATSEIPIAAEAEALPSPAEQIETAESSEPVLFSRSLTHFEESPLSRFRVMPFAILLLAVIAVISYLLVRGHKSETAPPVASQNAPASSPPASSPPASNPPDSSSSAPEKQAAAPAPSATSQTGPETSPPVSQPQPVVPPTEAQSAPTPEQPPPPPPSTLKHAAPRGRTEGLVTKRVIPTISPGARSGMRRPVQVVIRVSVNQDGVVSDAAYMSLGPGNYFARLAQRAAESWKFKPPTRNGDPERSIWTLRFNFDRGKTEVTATEATE